jgi:hypothetical protein
MSIFTIYYTYLSLPDLGGICNFGGEEVDSRVQFQANFSETCTV